MLPSTQQVTKLHQGDRRRNSKTSQTLGLFHGSPSRFPIETRRPCWIGLVTIPESVRELILFVDNDAGGLLAEKRAREAYARKDRRIVIQRPELPDEDWNDVLMRQLRAAI